MICRLIKWGYDSEDNIIKKPLHTIISRYKWFKKDYEDEMKRQRESMHYCPFMSSNKSKSKGRRK